MKRFAILAAFAVTALTSGAVITSADAKPKMGFTIIDGDTGEGYYDGHNDGVICRTRSVFAGYDWDGNPRYRRVGGCHGGFYW